MINLVEEDNKGKVKKTKKPFSFKALWASIKIGWKLLSTEKLVGGLVMGFFLLFGIVHFIYYAYLAFKAYVILQYIVYGFLGLMIFMIILRLIVMAIQNMMYRAKMKRIYKKIADHQKENPNTPSPDLGKNLIND